MYGWYGLILINLSCRIYLANVQVSRKHRFLLILGTLFLIDDPSLSSEGEEIKLMAGVGVVGVGDGKWLKVVEGVEVVMERVLDGELSERGCIDVEESRELDELGCINVVGRGSFGLLDGKG